MGRKKDQIRLFFKKIETDGRTRAQCQDCFEDIVPLASFEAIWTPKKPTKWPFSTGI